MRNLRGSRTSGGEVRERIISAACRCFSEEGYAGTAIHSVSREAGITPSTFYNHFASKRELLEEATSRVIAHDEGRFSAVVEEVGRRNSGSVPLGPGEIFRLLETREPRQMTRLRIEVWAEAVRDRELRSRLEGWIRTAATAVSRSLGNEEATGEQLVSFYLGLSLRRELERPASYSSSSLRRRTGGRP
ncbi:Bacterial regulatory protein, tetR family (plasmid) [Rubrobacter radiotolerans]|uniref:Bacterial regulatory protein, tetR family n=1 Tax=Rubrobacter radiotolerans TaxID=42256 RepID=A0A023X7P7_RUBRA|nr:TetR/AcrR family transcriptional regulator [Rubrobacter radiotolerans]AHY48368.1 Bacterial regulatory protein, tetR family [Rubrobacter radiotolerans]MDX5895505.1 helix-turn-helix domain-containing protein [Rubrobacter radiotolerans]SMC01568.1 transcriptional regulator, TetR family [Rubrobacter radiotolerans DSM 5868]